MSYDNNVQATVAMKGKQGVRDRTDRSVRIMLARTLPDYSQRHVRLVTNDQEEW